MNLTIYCCFRANIKPEDLFPYLESKKEFLVGKNLKRAHFQEAINQIEAAVSGEGDPAPISTQTENGKDAPEPEAAEVAEVPATAPKGKSQATKTESATAPAKQTPKSKRGAANNNNNTTTSTNAQTKTPKTKGSANKVAQVKDPTPPETLTPPPDNAEQSQPTEVVAEPVTVAPTATEPTDDAVMVPVPAKPVQPEEESPTNTTSRSGRKIKPKK